MPERRAGKERRAIPAKAGPTCLDCKKPTYTAADGKLRHDLRAAGDAQGGRGNDETPPKRDHPLNRKIFGGKSE